VDRPILRTDPRRRSRRVAPGHRRPRRHHGGIGVADRVGLSPSQDGSPLRGLNSINFGMANIANVLLAVGMVTLGLTQVVPVLLTWLSRRKTYHQLEPLWRTVTDAYPEIVLAQPVVPWPWRRLAPLSRRHAFYRRVMECRDGLVRLGPGEFRRWKHLLLRVR